MANDDGARFASRKELQARYQRGETWVTELTKHPKVDKYAGRYDVDQCDQVLKSGFRPTSRRKK